ncbi:MAG: RecQ family ATP-dependent DNA helicase, partial [Chloroflexota bacterium]
MMTLNADKNVNLSHSPQVLWRCATIVSANNCFLNDLTKKLDINLWKMEEHFPENSSAWIWHTNWENPKISTKWNSSPLLVVSSFPKDRVAEDYAQSLTDAGVTWWLGVDEVILYDIAIWENFYRLIGAGSKIGQVVEQTRSFVFSLIPNYASQNSFRLFGPSEQALFGEIRHIQVDSIGEPTPELAAYRPRALSAEAIARRYGKLNISSDNIIILDQESRKNAEGIWEIAEIAAIRSSANGQYEMLAHRRYFHHKQNQRASNKPSSIDLPEVQWSDKEAQYWQGLLDGKVLIGHHIGHDFDVLKEAGVSLKTAGLLDSLELALLVTPLMKDDEKRQDHSLHNLGKQLKVDQNDLFQGIGHPHEALYDTILCLLLIRKMLEILKSSPWRDDRLEALLQLLSPDYYLRRFLEAQRNVTKIRPNRVPLNQVLGHIPLPSEGKRTPTPSLPWKSASQVLGSGGPFSQIIENFSPRQVQCELATEIEACLHEGGILMAEAGTGTGKSLAALVAAFMAVQDGNRAPVVISTYTHVLQSQLVTKDLKDLKRALGRNIQTVVLKGRGNYLNLRALDAQRTEHLGRLRDRDDSQETRNRGIFLAFLLSWVYSNLEDERAHAGDLHYLFIGDIGEISSSWFGFAYGKDFLTYLNSLQEFPPLMDEAERPTNLVSLFWRALEYAKQADLVIVNHSLLFSSESVQKLSQRIILDEAHRIEEAFTNALTSEISADRCRGWVRLAQGLSASFRKGVPEHLTRDLYDRAKQLEGAVPGFALLFRKCLDVLAPNELSQTKEDRDLAEDAPYSRKIWLNKMGIDLTANARPQNAWLDEPAGIALKNALKHFSTALGNLEAVLTEDDAENKSLARSLLKQTSISLEVLQTVQSYDFEEANDYCWWMEEDERDLGVLQNQAQQFALKCAPIRVDVHFRQFIQQNTQSCVLMSATLSLRGGETVGPSSINADESSGFHFLGGRLGLLELSGVNVWSRPSPFDYARQMRVMLRQCMRAPSDPEQNRYLHELHAELLNILRNAATRGLVLFTSRRHLAALSNSLAESLHRPELRILPDTFLVQQHPGESAARLVEDYKSCLDKGEQALLIGTGSLWEGVDLSGEHGLNTVIIARLPFPPSGEPLTQARSQDVEQKYPGEQGGAFRHYLLPLTLLRWRQGIGRLIRNRYSRGVIICLDRRTVNADYAHDFWKALPEGAAQPIPCYTPEELVRCWAEFAAQKSFAECLKIADQPWAPKRMNIPAFDENKTIDEKTDDLEQTAKTLIGEGYCRNEEQIHAMSSFAEGKDVLLMMPTGGGKSVCFQVPALSASRGLTMVFSPLRALIQNQIDDLKNAGVPVPDMAGYLLGNGVQDKRERQRISQLAEDGDLRLLYLTPEMGVFDFTLFAKLKVQRIVLDEAHCLVTWGNTFRPDYLRLAQNIRDWRKNSGQNIAIMACSATLTGRYKQALCQQLELYDPVLIQGEVNRPNLYWGVDVINSSWGLRDRRLQEILVRLPYYTQAIVYTTYTGTCDQVAFGLIRHGFRAAAYHGKLDSLTRNQVLKRFENGPDDLQIVVATKAFGMGINNRNVGMVMHYNHPENMTEFYQQAGRAGRERGSRALAITLYNRSDRKQHEFLQSVSKLDADFLRTILDNLPANGDFVSEEDIIRQFNMDRQQASILFRRALELLKRAGAIAFREIVAKAKLVRSRDCPSSPPQELSTEQQEIMAKWLIPLDKENSFWYQIYESSSLESCMTAEGLLTLGIERNWWRVSRREQKLWMQKGEKKDDCNLDLAKVIQDEKLMLDNELNAMVSFLENDQD